MRTIIFIGFVFLFFGCQKTTSQKEINLGNSINYQIREDKKFNPKIIDMVHNYIDSVNYNKKHSIHTCRLFIEQRGQEITFKIGSVRYLSTVKDDLPFGYIKSGDIVILIYSGLEFFYEKDKSVPVSLDSVLKNKVINDLLPDLETRNPDISPMVSSTPTWECALRGDSVELVSTRAEPVSRIKTVIVPAAPNKYNVMNDSSVDSSTINAIRKMKRKNKR